MSEQQPLNPEAMRQLRGQVERLKRFLMPYEHLEQSGLPADPVGWDDNEALASIRGSALSDDPPKGWGTAKLAQFARGRVYGEQVMAGNIGEFVHFMLDIMDHPDKWTQEAIAARWNTTVETMFGEKPQS